jgi:hypothetical protein
VVEAFLGRLAAAPILSSLTLSGLPNSDGVCPEIAIDTGVLGVVRTDAHCDLMEMVKPLLEAAALMLWAIVAFRIVASA